MRRLPPAPTSTSHAHPPPFPTLPSYEGSFTTPPCTEVVTWLVQAEVQKIKPSQAKRFYDHIGGFPGNFRPPQPLGGRTITYKAS